MSSNQTLILNQNMVQCGLGVLTFTIPTTILNGPAVSNVIFTVACQVTVPSAVATDNGSGSGRDLGFGVTGTSPAYLPSYQTTGAQQGLGNGALGQGFQNSTPSGSFGGFDAGSSGGGSAGAVNDNAKAAVGFTAVSSSLVITVKQNGTTVYTAPTFTPTQGALQFKTDLLCNAADVITVTFTSSGAPDNTLNAIVSNVSIGNGE